MIKDSEDVYASRFGSYALLCRLYAVLVTDCVSVAYVIREW